MTETRAPFNGKKKELLLIELPMSAENVMTVRKHIMSQCVTNDAIVNGIRAIGTPVTGSELDESIHALVSAGVRKSLSKIAERDAEIGILKLEITHKDENILILKESLQSVQKERDAALGYVNSLQSALAEIQKGVEALNDPIEALESRTCRNTRDGEKA